MLVAHVLAGGLLLAFGRRLFWFFVAACGFAAAITLTNRFLESRSDWLALIAGLVVGVLGGLLALFFQRLAIGVAGFLAGSLIAVRLLDRLGFQEGPFFWIALVIGGILGAVLMKLLFDWSLIVLSCLAGTSLVVEALSLREMPGLLLWLVLFAVGITARVAQMRRGNRLR